MRRLHLPEHVYALLDAIVAISSDLDLHSVLDRIIVAACQITGAQYGAIGVIGQGGGELVDFVTHGLTDKEHEAIGELPRGHGILGLLIQHPQPLRLKSLQDHPQSYGFPPNHPPMESFLGVPVRIRGTVFGNLYLTEKPDGAEFTDIDEVLVEALASAAGFVIENAQTFARSERRRQWLEATASVTDALQPPVQLEEALRQIVVSARRVSGAGVVALLQSAGREREVTALDGPSAGKVAGLVEVLERDLAEAQATDEVVVVHAGSRRGVGTTVLVPLRTHLAPSGVLLVALESRVSFDPDELGLLSAYADQASLALDRAQALADREELLLVADRDRIARDLHDLVIQRLFATGLQLQGAIRNAVNEDVKQRLQTAVVDLDTTIRDIRSTIFELQHSRAQSLRAEVRAVVKEYVPVLGFSPLVRTAGPVDSVVPEDLAAQLLAVLRETLSNVARHAEAEAAVVEVEASDGHVVLRVTDNGKGLPEERHESGLRNVRRRAVEQGGTVNMLPEEPHGTRVEWIVPLPG
jgi:two-component system, NarL family, sensor histidine kinase DevS